MLLKHRSSRTCTGLLSYSLSFGFVTRFTQLWDGLSSLYCSPQFRTIDLPVHHLPAGLHLSVNWLEAAPLGGSTFWWWLDATFKPKTILPHQLWWIIFSEAWKMTLTYDHKESWIVRGMIKYGAISVYSFQLSMEHIIKSTKKHQHPPPENLPYDLASSILNFFMIDSLFIIK